MEEFRAIARLPQVDIEIRHRTAPEEGAEYLSLSLKATPSFEAAAAWLFPLRLAQMWLALNPFTAWMGELQATGTGRLGGPPGAPASLQTPKPDAGG